MSKRINREKAKGFSGSFGGAKNAASRTETPVSGRSTSTAYILGALCEGEIEGPVEWQKGVYLDEVPIQNADGSYNFKEHEFHFRSGTQIQDVIPFGAGNNTFIPTSINGIEIRDTDPNDAESSVFIYNNSLLPLNYVTFEIHFNLIGFERSNSLSESVYIPSYSYEVYARNDNSSNWVMVTSNTFAFGVTEIIDDEFGTSYVLATNQKTSFSLNFQQDLGKPSNYFQIKLKKKQVENNANGNIVIKLANYHGGTAGFDKQISLETPVQTEVKHNLPISRQFTSLTVNAIKVKLAFVLQRQDDQGSVYGERVDFLVWVKEPNQQNLVLKIRTWFEGRYPSQTEVDFLIPFDNAPFLNQNNANFLIRVEKVTPETNDAKIQRQLSWVSYTQITFTTLNYPNTAIAGFKFNTEYFQQIPSVAIKLAGRKIQIPSNAATVNTYIFSETLVSRFLSFSGNWNGTFYTPQHACSDPAWILYDLLTNTRYGLGNYIDTSQIDKWGLYEISKYCNTLVSDGSGGLEPRFSCNIKLEGKVEAYQVIQNLVSIFRGFAYWQAGVVSFVADANSSVVHQFTQADIEEGSFTYSRSGLKARKTVAVVSYLNPLDFYKKAVEVVEDPVGRAKWGVRELELEAIACISRGQARRAGVAALLTNRLEQESVTFRARAFAAYVKPGDLIRIYDSKRTAARYAGIIKSATATSVTLDSPVDLTPDINYKITVTTSKLIIPQIEAGANLSDPAQNQKLRFEVKEATIMTSGNNLTTVFLVNPGFGADVPPPESNWVIQGGALSDTIYRVINRSPVQDSIEGMHEILAVEYNSSKYSLIDEMSLL